MNKLNVMKYGYNKGTKTFRGVCSNIKQFFINIKYAYQRITKGFCEYDTWSLDTYYAKLISASLLDLAEHTHSYPGTGIYSDEQAQKDGFVSGYDRWVNTLIEIADHFMNSMGDTPSEYKEKSNKLYKMYITTGAEADRLAWLAQEEKCFSYNNEEKNKALDMLKEHYYNLWD